MHSTKAIFAFFLASFLSISLYSQINPNNITIARDSFGVPHIFAPTDAEVAYGLAWAHSEDDFEHVQKALLGAKGMLGRVDGLDGVIFDFGLQFFQVDSLVEARYETDISPDVKKVLEAFVQGLNDYAAAHPKEVLLKKALPFEPKDVVKGYVLPSSLMAGIGLALIATRENKVEEYLNVNDVGSNAMAIAPERMQDGKGYLLSNSHQPIEGNFAWYEAHLSSEEGWNIMGGLFPGALSIFVGTNEKLAWAHTNNYFNFGDVHLLEINPKNKKQYKYEGEWRNLRIEKAKLKVKLLGIPIPIKRKMYYCEYGPVFKTKHGMYAFRFPGYTDIRSIEQWFRMNKAQNLAEFEEALKMQSLPLFNVLYVDVEGNILYHSGGRVADRNPDLDWKWPITAATKAYKWEKIVPYEHMPLIINPECGFVYNANNTPLHASGDACNWEGDFPGMQKFEYNRGEVFGKRLKEYEGKFTEAYLDELKFSTGYLDDEEGTYLSRFKVFFELNEQKYPDIAEAIQMIQAWDMNAGLDDESAGLMMVVHDVLHRELKLKFGFLMIRQTRITEEEAVSAIRKAQKILKKGHGTIHVPLGKLQYYIRGDKMVPADGLREVPRAVDTKLYNKRKGIYKVTGGDSFIQVVRFSEGGPEIKSVNAYGASQDPKSPHYDDQMELFSQHKYKQMTLNKKAVLKTAIRVYHPGE